MTGAPVTLAVPGWLLLLVAAATALMVLEAALLLLWHRRTGSGLAPRTLLPTLAAGGALMATLLALLLGAPPLALLPLLALAGAAHGLDLHRRWVRRGLPPG